MSVILFQGHYLYDTSQSFEHQSFQMKGWYENRTENNV